MFGHTCCLYWVFSAGGSFMAALQFCTVWITDNLYSGVNTPNTQSEDIMERTDLMNSGFQGVDNQVYEAKYVNITNEWNISIGLRLVVYWLLFMTHLRVTKNDQTLIHLWLLVFLPSKIAPNKLICWRPYLLFTAWDSNAASIVPPV